MATRYTKTQIRSLISDNSDHSSPDCRSTFTAVTNTVTEGLAYTVTAVSGGTGIDLTNFTTLNEVILHNTDTTNYVDVTFTTANGGTSGAVMRVPAGGQICLTDVDPVNTFSLATASADVCVDLMAWGD